MAKWSPRDERETKSEQTAKIASSLSALPFSIPARAVIVRAKEIRDGLERKYNQALLLEPLNILEACLEADDVTARTLAGDKIWLTQHNVRAVVRTMDAGYWAASPSEDTGVRRLFLMARDISKKEHHLIDIRTLAIASVSVGSANVAYVLNKRRSDIYSYLRALHAPAGHIDRIMRPVIHDRNGAKRLNFFG